MKKLLLSSERTVQMLSRKVDGDANFNLVLIKNSLKRSLAE